MKHSALATVAILVATLAACSVEAPAPVGPPEFPGMTPLSGVVHGEGGGTLVVLLHGDVSSGYNDPADYLYSRAEELGALDGVTAAAILRPGYPDSAGRRSPGSNNQRRDHYTAENNRLVAETIANLAAARGDPKVIVMGHSGGAAQAGVIAGQRPSLIDVAVLASCPCDIVRWREYRGRPWPHSQSPSDYIAQIDPSTKVVAVTGAADTNTLPVFASDYVAALQARGIEAEFVPVPDAEHSFWTIADAVMEVIRSNLGET